MEYKTLSYKTSHNVYYVENNVIYKIDKSIDKDDCVKFIAIDKDEEYKPVNNEIPFVPETIGVTYYVNDELKSETLYLDNLINVGDTSVSGKFKPNPSHNLLNLSTNQPEKYVDIIEDFYKTQVINEFINGKNLNAIYNSLPTFCKKGKDAKGKNINSSINIGLSYNTDEPPTLELSAALKKDVSTLLSEKYKAMINKDLDNLQFGQEVDKITFKNKS